MLSHLTCMYIVCLNSVFHRILTVHASDTEAECTDRVQSCKKLRMAGNHRCTKMTGVRVIQNQELVKIINNISVEARLPMSFNQRIISA